MRLNLLSFVYVNPKIFLLGSKNVNDEYFLYYKNYICNIFLSRFIVQQNLSFYYCFIGDFISYMHSIDKNMNILLSVDGNFCIVIGN